MNHLCPVDLEPLKRYERNGVFLLSCPDCHGTWITRGNLELVARQHQLPEPMHLYGGTEPVHLHDAIERGDGAIPCFCDGQPLMDTVTRHGVRIDICSICEALWFDAEEMRLYLREKGVARRFKSGRSSGSGDAFATADLVVTLLEPLLFIAEFLIPP